MRILCLMLLLDLAGIKTFSQETQSDAALKSNKDNKSYSFYTSCQDSLIDNLVVQEIQFLAANFFVKPSCYFYGYADSLLTGYRSEPKFENDNVFLNISLFRKPLISNTDETNCIVILTHQFAQLLVKKYKLDLSYQEYILFTDYFTGYYLNIRNRYFKKIEVDDACQNQFKASNTDEYVSPDMRIESMKKGFYDSTLAYKKRMTVTLNDIINLGVDFAVKQSL